MSTPHYLDPYRVAAHRQIYTGGLFVVVVIGLLVTAGLLLAAFLLYRHQPVYVVRGADQSAHVPVEWL